MDRKTHRELRALLSALLDGALAPAQQDRLGEMLRESPEARDLYLAYFDLHADLALRGAPPGLTRPVLPLAGGPGAGGRANASDPHPAGLEPTSAPSGPRPWSRVRRGQVRRNRCR